MVNLAVVGSNNPPGPIEHAQSVVDDINSWLADHPVIESEDHAREEVEADGVAHRIVDTEDPLACFARELACAQGVSHAEVHEPQAVEGVRHLSVSARLIADEPGLLDR